MPDNKYVFLFYMPFSMGIYLKWLCAFGLNFILEL